MNRNLIAQMKIARIRAMAVTVTVAFWMRPVVVAVAVQQQQHWQQILY